jgi:MFS family permease
VLDRVRDKNIRLIYLTILLVGIAYGTSIAVIAHALDERGFAKGEIGELAAIFASGIVVMSLPAGVVLRRLSAKTTLVVSLLGYALTVGLFPLLRTFGWVAFARFFDGAFSVGVWVSCETILLVRSDENNKAYVTSLYAVSMAIGYVVGPLLAMPIVRASSLDTVFFVASGIAVAAGLLVLGRLEPDRAGGAGDHVLAAPETASASVSDARRRVSASSLLWRIKTSCFATFAYGYFQSSVVLFLPLFLVESKAVTRENTFLVTAFFAAGMLLFSNGAGRIGDRVGHLLVMRTCGAIGLVMVLGFVFLDSFAWMAVAVFVAGATLASISPVSLAFLGVVVPKADASRANAIYNLFYAGGMLLGPPISSVLFDKLGGGAMLYHLAALWAAFVAFATAYGGDDPAKRHRVAPPFVPAELSRQDP